MKMPIKKEQIILALIIFALLLYLIFRKQDNVNYRLPDLPEIPRSEITSIEIARPDDSIVLEKADEDWVISPQGYPVNSSYIDNILDFIEAPALSVMVSDSESYSRYGLDDDNRIIVRALAGTEPKREIALGNSTNSNRHTFVKLSDDHRVYHANGNQRANFDKDMDEFRDKNVLTFDPDEIGEIQLTKDALSITLTRVTLEVAEEEAESQALEEENIEWQTPEGEKAEKSLVDDLLSTLSGLTCQSFLYEINEGDMTDPLCSVTLKDQKEYILTIFPKKDDAEGYPTISSENESPFILPDWKAEKIIEKPDTIIKKPEDAQEAISD
jgi:hypothetical protein